MANAGNCQSFDTENYEEAKPDRLKPENDAGGYPPLSLESATSTTSIENEMKSPSFSDNSKAPPLTSDPAEWSVDDVMRYLTSVDSGLSVHAQLFQKHVILIPHDSPIEIIKNNSSSVPGNRRQSVTSSDIGHDDEIHGPQIGTVFKNLQLHQPIEGTSTRSCLMVT